MLRSSIDTCPYRMAVAAAALERMLAHAALQAPLIAARKRSTPQLVTETLQAVLSVASCCCAAGRYQYHPPFTFGIQRVNEVLYEVKEATKHS
jgi:hypothetical protein